MAKKIRFPLQMNGTDVRTIEELREHFDLESVLGYFANGKLVTWLRNRYYDKEADAIEALSADDAELNNKIMCALGISVDTEAEHIDMETIQRRNEKLMLLRQLTDDQELINKIDSIAFNQDDLTEMLEKGAKEIYLCRGEFEISLEQVGIAYTRLFNPTVSVVGEDAQYQMGMRFYQGDGVEKDYSKAFDLLSKSADNGNMKALVQVGICYYYGRGTALNYAKAVECFKKVIELENQAIESEDKDAYFWLGKCYLYGYVPNIECWFWRTANLFYEPHCYNLLLAFYCFCKSRNDDITKWYMLLCYGIDMFFNHFGDIDYIYQENSNWIDNRHDDSRTSRMRLRKEIEEINVEQMLLDLIESGDIDAEFELGRLYFYGDERKGRGYGIGRNLGEAKRLILDSVENNQSAAQWWFVHNNDFSYEKSFIINWISENEKIEWCKQSYLNGCIYAAGCFGLHDFTRYNNVPELWYWISKNINLLFDWYRQLANDGNRYAQYWMYRYLWDKDEDEALKWLMKSAENGYAVAQSSLGAVYENRKYIDNANYWRTKASEQFIEFKNVNKSRIYFKEHFGIDLENITID